MYFKKFLRFTINVNKSSYFLLYFSLFFVLSFLFIRDFYASVVDSSSVKRYLKDFLRISRKIQSERILFKILRQRD